MITEPNTEFIPLKESPKKDFILAKDANGTVFVFSSNHKISAPYSIAIAMEKLFGFSFRDGHMTIVDVQIPARIMTWLVSSEVANLVFACNQSNQ